MQFYKESFNKNFFEQEDLPPLDFTELGSQTDDSFQFPLDFSCGQQTTNHAEFTAKTTATTTTSHIQIPKDTFANLVFSTAISFSDAEERFKNLTAQSLPFSLQELENLCASLEMIQTHEGSPTSRQLTFVKALLKDIHEDLAFEQANWLLQEDESPNSHMKYERQLQELVVLFDRIIRYLSNTQDGNGKLEELWRRKLTENLSRAYTLLMCVPEKVCFNTYWFKERLCAYTQTANSYCRSILADCSAKGIESNELGKYFLAVLESAEKLQSLLQQQEQLQSVGSVWDTADSLLSRSKNALYQDNRLFEENSLQDDLFLQLQNENSGTNSDGISLVAIPSSTDFGRLSYSSNSTSDCSIFASPEGIYTEQSIETEAPTGNKVGHHTDVIQKLIARYKAELRMKEKEQNLLPHEEWFLKQLKTLPQKSNLSAKIVNKIFGLSGNGKESDSGSNHRRAAAKAFFTFVMRQSVEKMHQENWWEEVSAPSDIWLTRDKKLYRCKLNAKDILAELNQPRGRPAQWSSDCKVHGKRCKFYDCTSEKH
jgi:hypothetical protein